MNLAKVNYEKSFGTAAQLPPSEGVEIVFSGRSNVGKSSLLNKLLGRKNLARVSSMPGKTTTVNFYRGEGFRLVDLPGYGYAKRSRSEQKRWADLMEGFFQMGREIGLVIQLIDIRHPPTADDRTMIDFLIDAELPFVIALTKADKLSRRQQQERLAALPDELGADITLIPVSSETGQGIETLRQLIDEITADEPDQPDHRR